MSVIRFSRRKNLRLAALVCVSVVCSGGAFAATPPGFTLGSPNVAIADPPVPRPATASCTVQLFSDFTFTDFSNHPYTYAPPAGCKGPWSKVVLEGDFSVTAGRQFDRTASIWLAGSNIYFGTTEEPSATVAPTWHIERELTDFSSLLGSAQTGQVVLGNVVDGTYTGVIHGSAKLVFYKSTLLFPAAQSPDAVYALSDGGAGSPVNLNTGTDTLSRSITLPTNIERAYVDVFAQGQQGDEFWYSCVPNEVADEAESCGGGSFRQTQVSIDGKAAGVAPVYPWIFTGGIDPYMWRPTTGVQTLNFLPYRVDLTPFASQLNDGKPHTLAIGVTGANSYFSVTGNLFVYLDHKRKVVTGAVTANTLASQPAQATVANNLTDTDGVIGGNVATTASRTYRLAGYVDTSHGRVSTDVRQTVSFANTQAFTINTTRYDQAIDQQTTVDSSTTTREGIFGLAVVSTLKASYPLKAEFTYNFDDAGNYVSAPSAVSQGFEQHVAKIAGSLTLYRTDTSNTIHTGDTLTFTDNAVTGHTGQASTQAFRFSDNLGSCYARDIGSNSGTLASVVDGNGCARGRNLLLWFTHPDGSPDTSRTQTPYIF